LRALLIVPELGVGRSLVELGYLPLEMVDVKDAPGALPLAL
jgi:hypothetical protein